MPHSVRLTPLDTDGIERLLTVAIAEATEEDVMPPVDEPPGWTPTRQEAFRQFYRLHHEVMYEVVETGMWLGSSARGKGIGTEVLRAVLEQAVHQGWTTVVADTTSDNAPALSALVGCGAAVFHTDAKVVATFAL